MYTFKIIGNFEKQSKLQGSPGSRDEEVDPPNEGKSCPSPVTHRSIGTGRANPLGTINAINDHTSPMAQYKCHLKFFVLGLGR